MAKFPNTNTFLDINVSPIKKRYNYWRSFSIQIYFFFLLPLARFEPDKSNTRQNCDFPSCWIVDSQVPCTVKQASCFPLPASREWAKSVYDDVSKSNFRSLPKNSDQWQRIIAFGSSEMNRKRRKGEKNAINQTEPAACIVHSCTQLAW